MIQSEVCQPGDQYFNNGEYSVDQDTNNLCPTEEVESRDVDGLAIQNYTLNSTQGTTLPDMEDKCFLGENATHKADMKELNNRLDENTNKCSSEYIGNFDQLKTFSANGNARGLNNENINNNLNTDIENGECVGDGNKCINCLRLYFCCDAINISLADEAKTHKHRVKCLAVLQMLKKKSPQWADSEAVSILGGNQNAGTYHTARIICCHAQHLLVYIELIKQWFKTHSFRLAVSIPLTNTHGHDLENNNNNFVDVKYMHKNVVVGGEDFNPSDCSSDGYIQCLKQYDDDMHAIKYNKGAQTDNYMQNSGHLEDLYTNNNFKKEKFFKRGSGTADGSLEYVQNDIARHRGNNNINRKRIREIKNDSDIFETNYSPLCIGMNKNYNEAGSPESGYGCLHAQLECFVLKCRQNVRKKASNMAHGLQMKLLDFIDTYESAKAAHDLGIEGASGAAVYAAGAAAAAAANALQEAEMCKQLQQQTGDAIGDTHKLGFGVLHMLNMYNEAHTGKHMAYDADANWNELGRGFDQICLQQESALLSKLTGGCCCNTNDSKRNCENKKKDTESLLSFGHAFEVEWDCGENFWDGLEFLSTKKQLLSMALPYMTNTNTNHNQKLSLYQFSNNDTVSEAPAAETKADQTTSTTDGLATASMFSAKATSWSSPNICMRKQRTSACCRRWENCYIVEGGGMDYKKICTCKCHKKTPTFTNHNEISAKNAFDLIADGRPMTRRRRKEVHAFVDSYLTCD